MATVAQRSSLFERTMDNLDLSKSDVNNLIMDYLITKGYPSAAEKFAAEANIEPRQDHSNIYDRVQIRDLILQGNLQEAIEAINELDIQLLDRNKKLHFSLLRLQLIELIKKSFIDKDPATIGAAIEFATDNLAPYTLGNEAFRIDLERAMALLLVPKETWSDPKAQGGFGHLATLVSPDLRREIARDVNEAILKSQGMRQEANIDYLIKARAWSEQEAHARKIPLPLKLELTLQPDTSGSSNGHTSGGDTEMSENGGGTDNGDHDMASYINVTS